MKYTINYTKQGKILGFAKGDTDLNIEVSNDIWFEAQSYNKIIVDGDNITFEKVDWRTPEEIEEQEQAQFRTEKEDRLSKIVVTTQNGNTFDGNETARNNMLSAITSAEFVGKTEEYWKLADNSTVLIQLPELKEALALAIQEVGNIVKDY